MPKLPPEHPDPKPRVLLGTHEIAAQLYVYQDGLRRLGYPATTVVHRKHPFYPDLEYDHQLPHLEVLQSLTSFQDQPLDVLLSERGKNLLEFRDLVEEHDIFVFQWGRSLAGYLHELALLKSLGKKIICIFNGSDVRTAAASGPAHDEWGIRLAPSQREDPVPMNFKLGILRRAELWADAIIALPTYMQMALRPFVQFDLPMMVERIPQWSVPGRSVPVVVHAPSNKDVKGTPRILEALDALRREGVAFELKLLHGVSNQVVLDTLRDADVAVDQLDVAFPATFALEAMLSGCAVAGGNRPDIVARPPNRPMINIDHGNVVDQLRRLLTDRDLRIELGQAARPWVLRYYDHIYASRLLIHSVERIAAGDHDYVPRWYVDRYEALPHDPISPENRVLTREVVKRWNLFTPKERASLVRRKLMAAG